MKKWIALFLTVAMTVSLTACARKNSTAETAVNSGTAESTTETLQNAPSEAETSFSATSTGETDTTTPIPTETSSTETQHTHKYTEKTTAPSCTEKGYTTYTCSCGHTYKDKETAATGHKYTEAVTAPSCTEKGYTTYTCSCGHTYKDKETAATGHKYTEAVTAPSCTEKGYTTYTCSCGYTYKDKETAATGHKWGEWKTTKEPTETVEGTAERSCSACSQKETKKLAVLSHAHKYTEAVTAPSCTEKGYTTYTCSCGHTYKDKEAAATGHNWQAATCKTPKTCKVCNTQEGSVGAHSYSNGACTICGDPQYQSMKDALLSEHNTYVGNFAIRDGYMDGGWLIGFGINFGGYQEGEEFWVALMTEYYIPSSEVTADYDDPVIFDGLTFYCEGAGFNPHPAEVTESELIVKTETGAVIVKFALQKDGYLVVTESNDDRYPVGMLLSVPGEEFLRVN